MPERRPWCALAAVLVAGCTILAPVDDHVALAVAGEGGVEDKDGGVTVGEDGSVADAERDTAGPVSNGPYATAVLSQNPIHYWRLGARDPGSPAVDLGSKSTPGKFVGSIALGVPGATGDNDTAARFDGASSIELGAAGAFPGQKAFTVELWIRPGVGSGSRAIVSRFGAGGSGYELQINGTAVRFLRFGGSGVAVNGTAPALGTSFHHVAATYDGTTLRLYWDGTKIGEAPASEMLADEPIVLLLAKSGAATPAFVGDLDELAMFERALTPTVLAEHANLR